MRRQLMVLAMAGLFGGLLLTSEAGACCHKRRCAQPCATVATCPAPAPAPVAECAPKKCGLFGGHKLFGCCHKKRAAVVCEVAPACPAPIPCAPTYYYAPPAQVIPSIQAVPSGQG